MNPEQLRMLMEMQMMGHQPQGMPQARAMPPSMNQMMPQPQQASPMGEVRPVGMGGQPDPAALMRALLGPGAGMGGGMPGSDGMGGAATGGLGG